MLYKNSESVNFLKLLLCCDVSLSSPYGTPPRRLRDQKKYPKKVSFRPTGNKPIFCFGLNIIIKLNLVACARIANVGSNPRDEGDNQPW